MKRATLYIVILGIVCIGLGVVGGIVIEKRYMARNFPRIARSQLFRGRAGGYNLQKRGMQGFHQRKMQRFTHREGQKAGAAHICERLGQRLNLSSEQKEKVQAVLVASKQEIEQARDEFRTQLDRAREKSHTQILEVLNPEQKEKYEELTAKMKQRKGK